MPRKIAVAYSGGLDTSAMIPWLLEHHDAEVVAVVVDVGAPMSHAVIVSRELDIPCAISVPDAARRIPDGAVIEVDGGAGTVTIVESP